MSITEPGLYDIPEAEYHADPIKAGSLSASASKWLLPPYVPADFRYRMDHPEEKYAYDFGHLLHSRVLGVGQPTEIVHKINQRKERVPAETMDGTKSATEDAARIRAEGHIPVLEKDLAVADEMLAVFEQHDVATALMRSGRPEVSAAWVDAETGVWRRCRFDILPEAPTTGRLIIPDYKTAAAAHPREFNRKLGDFTYPQQMATYVEGASIVLGIPLEDIAFVFVVQQKTPPYHVSVVEPDAEWLRIGRERMSRALRIYKDCRERGEWPAFPGVTSVSPPTYVVYRHEDDMTEGDEAA